MSDYEAQVKSEHAFERAKRENLEVILPDEHTLMIDIDNEDLLKIFYDRWNNLEYWECFEGKSHRIVDSKTKGHKHIYVRLPKMRLTATQRIFLQLYLGSDPRREFLCLQRILKNDPHPTLFFEKESQ